MTSALPEIQHVSRHTYTFIVKMLLEKKGANYMERGQKEKAGCLKGRALQERNRKMLLGIISSLTLPMQEHLYFTVSKFPIINKKNLEYSKEQIQGFMLLS